MEISRSRNYPDLETVRRDHFRRDRLLTMSELAVLSCLFERRVKGVSMSDMWYV